MKELHRKIHGNHDDIIGLLEVSKVIIKMDFGQEKSSSPGPLNTSNASANTNMTKDKHFMGSRSVSTIACKFEAKNKEKIETETTSTSRTETTNNKNKNSQKGVSTLSKKADAENSICSFSNATTSINDDDGEFIFQLDEEDDLNLYLPDDNSLTGKKTSDVELFDESFEALSVDKLSASLFEKRSSDNKCLRLSSGDEDNSNESIVLKSTFSNSNTPKSSTPKRLPIRSRSKVNVDETSHEYANTNAGRKIKSTCESITISKLELPSRLDDGIQKEDSQVNRITDPMPPSLEDRQLIGQHSQGDEDVNDTASLLSSDDYDESDDNDGSFSESQDLSPSNYLLTVDDVNFLKRSCATASTCSIQSDFDNELLSLDSSYSDSEGDQEPEPDEENDKSAKGNDNKVVEVMRGKKTASPRMINESLRTSRSASGKSRLYIPPPVPASNALNVTWPTPTPNSHRSNRKAEATAKSKSHRSNRKAEATATSNSHRSNRKAEATPSPDSLKSNRKRVVRANTPQNYRDFIKQHDIRNITRKLFDPYADQRRLSKTLSSQSKRYWNFDAPKKGHEMSSKEDWPALLENLPSLKLSKEAKQNLKQPTYAQVLTKPKPKPKHHLKYLKKSAKELTVSYKSVVMPTEDNALSPKGDEDTGPPCRGELLVSNSVTAFSLNKDGSTSVGVYQDKGNTSSTVEKDKEKHLTHSQKSLDFQDPAIVAIGSKFQSSSCGIDSNHVRPLKLQSFDKTDLLSLLLRPAVQHEDPAIVSVHHAVATLPLETLENKLPTQAYLPLYTPKKQAAIDDPAIIYAHRIPTCPATSTLAPQPTCPTLSSLSSSSSMLVPQPAQQTGFWSAQENISNSNSFVTSNPLMNQHALTTHTYSTTCYDNVLAECPSYMGIYYPLNSCMLATAPSNCVSGVVCNC